MNKRSKILSVTVAVVALIGLLVWGGISLFSSAGRQSPGTAGNRVGGGVQARPSTPAAMSSAEVAAIKIPRGLHLARLPWPSGGKLLGEFHLAQLPWLHDRGAADISRLHIVATTAYGTGALANSLNLVHRAYVPWPKFPGLTLPITGKFVTALCRDKAGNIWIATEDHGVFRYNPSAPKGKQIQQFTKQSTHGQLGNNNIYALACDNHGRIWAGTLNRGVSVWNGKRWQDYGVVQNPKKHVLTGPLGDHVFALKFDKFSNQMWICTEAGISIYQCSSRRGSAGQIAEINPAARQTVTGNLSPVTFTAGTWHYITQADGLPQNPDCVAFAPNGTVYVGTQCDGIAIATINEQRSTNNDPRQKSGVGSEEFEVSGNTSLPNATAPRPPTPGSRRAVSLTTPVTDNLSPPASAAYQWRVVTGPWKMPLTATGRGLPSNLINAIVFEPNGTLIAGTDGGIGVATNKNAASDSSSADWTFMRGRDLTAKVAGLWHPPQHWKAPSRKVLNTLPMEDYTTALALNEQGPKTNDQKKGVPANLVIDHRSLITDLWLGHRQRGIDVWQYSPQGKIIKRLRIHEPQIGNYVTALLPLPGGAVAVGTYGKGVSIINLPGTSEAWERISRIGKNALSVSEPRGAAPTTHRQLAALYQNLLKNNIPRKSAGPQVVPITDDWRTEGSWLGRYGRYWACLFACIYPPMDYVWGPGGTRWIGHREGMGPHHRKGDSVRFYVTWYATAKKRVLELPGIYLDSRVLMHLTAWKLDRRESEIDDHGESYPMSWQGPGLYVYLHIPPGAYRLSLYFFNKDGHSGNNRDRDYAVSAIPLPAGYHFGTASRPNTVPLAKMRGITQGRVVNFWGGVWKRFLVRGPMKLAIRVAKNYSLNTILQAAMLDPLAEHPAPYYYGYRAWQIHEKQKAEFRTRLIAAWRSGQIPWHRHPGDDPVGNPSTKSSNQHSGALAANIIQALNLLEHRAPVVWAANQELDFTLLLRWCAANYGAIPKTPATAAIAEQCYYHLGLFHRWEAVEKSRGMLTSRQIEEGLRWNPETAFLSVNGFHAIRSYLRDPNKEEGKAREKRE